MKIGFACAWDKVPERTWSGIPWRLRGALEQHTDLTDLSIKYSWAQAFLKYVHFTRRHGCWLTTYQMSSHWDRLVQKKLQSSLVRTPVDTVFEVGDLARLGVPYYLYQDLSFDVLERFYEPTKGVPGFPGVTLDTIKRRRDRQHEIYESATGVFAMSRWFANTLVEWSGVPPSKVSVVYAGLNSRATMAEESVELKARAVRKEPVKLLFVGRDFLRKGGDIVLKALAQLRREHLPRIQLTVAGPDRWPLPTAIPEGVFFLGNRTNAEVAQLYCDHDLFVMPSRFEAFGIAFAEALAHGVPVIGRSSFAMPEIIRSGKNGALVDSDDPAELASTILAVLYDPAVSSYTTRNIENVRAQFSWESVAEKIVSCITGNT